MHQTNFQFRENVILQAFAFVNSGFDFIVITGFDQGINDESLMSLCDLLSNFVINAFTFAGINDHGLNGQTTEGQFIHDADIQITKDCELERARNWGCGHNQQMGVVAFVSQSSPLSNAKAMLFVDYNHL